MTTCTCPSTPDEPRSQVSGLLSTAERDCTALLRKLPEVTRTAGAFLAHHVAYIALEARDWFSVRSPTNTLATMGNAPSSNTRLYQRIDQIIPTSERRKWEMFDTATKPFAGHKDREQFICENFPPHP